MSLTLEYEPVNRIVETVNVGIVTAKDLSDEVEQAVVLGNKNGCRRFLSDHSQSEVRYSFLDVYELPSLYAAHGLDRSCWIAIIPPASEDGAEIANFQETVCHNRGWNIRKFEDRREALEWLLESPSLDQITAKQTR